MQRISLEYRLIIKKLNTLIMKRQFLLIIALFFTVYNALAQYTVIGCVTDSTGTGEPYATIRIFKQSNKEKAIKIGTTDIDGKFSQELSSAGKYTLMISSVGKMTINEDFELTATSKAKDFGTLIIKNDANTLAGVEVVAQKPLVTTEIDRISYDIKNDEESKTSNIFDMLRKVPMVTIDGEDKILVNGSSNFKIYKNGRPNTAWSNNPKEVLKSIPASMIKRIEVITEPGAKYDAEGVAGILNIITDENSIINGVVGSVSGNTNTNGMHGGNTYITTQVGKLTTSINYNFSTLGKANTSPYYNSEYTYTESGNKLMSSGSNEIKTGGFHYGNIEASYEIDTLNLITFSFGGYLFDTDNFSSANYAMYSKNNELIYSYKTNNRTPKSCYFDFNGKLDYQHLTHNKGEALTLSYLISTTNQENNNEVSYYDLINFPLNYDNLKSNSKLNFYEHTFQFDWTRPFAQKHKLEMGLKYILRQNFSKTQYEYNNGVNEYTDFDHITNIGAAYSEYSFNSKKWGARAGVRYEFAHLKGDNKKDNEASFSSNIGDIVPTLSASYKINDSNTLKLNFATRINRPGISYLNPAVNESPTSISYGNPNLKSTRRNSVRLSYSLMKQKIILSTSTNFTWANNSLMSLQWIKDGITYSTYANSGKARGFSWNLYTQWTPTKSTQLMLNGSLSYKKYQNVQNLENDGWGKNLYANIKQNLPWKLTLNANMYYWYGGIHDTYSKGGDVLGYGFNLSRSFLKEDRLTVKLGAQSPFSAKYRKGNFFTIQGGRTGFNEYHNYQRAFGINISYRFGSLKANVKKTNKTISNDDLEGRK